MLTNTDAVRTRAKGRELPIVVGITHADRVPAFSLERYREAFSASRCSCSQCRPPIQRVDARSAHDVAMLLLVMSALLEAQQRVPERILHQQMSAGIAQAA